MTGMTSFKCTPRQTRKHVVRALLAGLVPYIQSSPGMGKSAIVRSIAEEYNMELLDIRLSTCAPTDLTGLPHFNNGIAEFMPFDFFPTEKQELPEGKNGWIIFLDEFNSAPKSVQAAAYKLVLDRMVGLHHLHERVMIVAAGNLATDRAIVNPLSTAMQSRVIHLEMELHHGQFMEDVAFKQGWDSRVVAYLSYMPGKLHDFRPDHNDKTFCCPRTWEFINKLITGQEYSFDPDGNYSMDEEAALFAGAVTSGVATEFIQFTKVFKELPKLPDIMRDPANAMLPVDPALRYATVTFLIENSNDKNFEKITEYLNRFTSEFRVLFFRGLMIRKPDLRAHPAFRSAMLELSRYLHD